MRQEVKYMNLVRAGFLVFVGAFANAFAQVPAAGSYGAAMHAAVREIAKDPCNSSGKISSLLPPIFEAAKREHAGTQDMDEFLQRLADTGCRNSRLAIPKIELLLSAGKLGFLDACAYSPQNDYAVELAMARTHYHPQGVGITAYQLRDVPCLADFIAALLTDQAVSPSAPPPATPAAPAPPAAAPTRRRTN